MAGLLELAGLLGLVLLLTLRIAPPPPEGVVKGLEVYRESEPAAVVFGSTGLLVGASVSVMDVNGKAIVGGVVISATLMGVVIGSGSVGGAETCL